MGLSNKRWGKREDNWLGGGGKGRKKKNCICYSLFRRGFFTREEGNKLKRGTRKENEEEKKRGSRWL